MTVRMVATLLVVLSACGTAGTAPDAALTPSGTVEVLSVTDGDTFDVELRGRRESVRLVGVDAPERGECFAPEATAALRALVADRPVRLARDTSDRDDFGRLLRHVFVGDEHVNAALVRGGYALARRYPPDTGRADELEAAEDQARSQDAGLWGEDGCRSGTSADLTLAVHADAPGDDGRNPNGEWLDLRNDGAAAVDLSGWVVRDGSASNRYMLAEGTLLPPGETLRLRSGCGDDGPRERYWCREGAAVWNNDGDVAMLLDAGGRIVATHRYDGSEGSG